ncbi:MAG: DUF2244 domain-containing protein [Geminicoccaceae bacterium]|nr:DUF2244 domain-containing protein [Geminicoccaceae bacterium]MCS7268371.1 DUF2244 domain-containing protein [Geminicoccaceae bacterium]MCX7629434.1 DUF2244 domain-containing protein [Geminicoccaceae bacterium]MDW8124264.1 DUF2244 domain-containing protein [Geminicoccaceae bacterium]MDW8341127.1 DUF2244 domain-containing protein [Geminicoccaceae bacterium]
MTESSAPPPFRAVLYPNRSLGPYGAAIVLLAFAAVSGALGCVFALLGAWPVTGFLGLDVLLLVLATRVVRRRARLREEIRLDRSGLWVSRIDPDGREECVRFEPYWVRVQLEEPDPASVRLWLRSHGRRLRIGAFLNADECRELAVALDRALAPYR